ncbi:choice-of-anchor D domain-containing protein, partial [Candidatus Binatus sp.]|uniref:choice-of-anchor D domain-containing protein n=1 Tax=Candidatus Binatus sp. TaxID=2811406 RepID=UPI003C333EBA
LALTSGTNPSFYGQPLTFTGTVTDDSSNPITCGTLTFNAGANPISGCTGVALGSPGSDQAQCTTSTLLPGSYNITAVYTPSPSGCLYLPGTSNTVGQVVQAELKVTPYGVVFGNSTFANSGTTVTYGYNGITALNQSAVPVSIGAITTPTSTLNGAPVSINACLGGSIPGASCTMDSDCTGGGTCVLNPNFQPINLYLCTGGSNPGANCLGASDVTSCTGGGTCGVNPSFPPVKLYDCMGGSNPGASCTGTNDVTSCTGGGTCTLVNMYACVDGTNPGAACTGPSDVTSCTGGGTCASNPNFQPCANQTLEASGTPGDACVFTASFTATALGNFMGTADVPSGAANTPNMVTLSGTGVAPSINLPPAVSFGNTVVGTVSATKTATVKNTNSVGVTISSVTVSGPFAIVSDGCTGMLPANSSCTETVSFSPTAAGAAAGTLTFAGNFSNTGAMVNLTGTGTLNAPTFTPSSLAFGAVSVGLNTTKTVTVSNPNNAVGIPMTSVTVTALSSDYTIGTDTCSGTTLAPSGMCTVSVTFAPTTAGARAGQLTFVDQGGSGSQKYALSGSGK